MSEETKQLLYALLDGQKEMSATVKSLDARVTSLDARTASIDERLLRVESGQETIKSQLSKVESSLDLLANREWQNEKEINFVKKQIENHF